MNGNFRLGSLFGIPFYLNISWFLVLALVTFDYGTGLKSQFPWLGTGLTLSLGLITALLLFTSVLLHELGHSFAARKQGINVHSITLFLFGGMASLERESATPAGAFWVAIAGPLVSVALFMLLLMVGSTTPLPSPIAAIVGILAYINLALALFNLIPGLPLDGGNVLKALVWKLTGNRYQGTRFASGVGQFIGWVAILVGLLSMFRLIPFGSAWTALIGWFLLQNAGQAAQSATIQERLADLTAADAVTVNSPIVETDRTLREFVDEVVLENSGNWKRFLVKNAAGQLLGTVSINELRTIPTDQWSTLTVGQFVQPVAQNGTVRSDLPLLEVMNKMEEYRTSVLTVVRENDILVGLLEKPSILRLLQGQYS
jgi:Zn-dependent protease/CBS domain-containing protein